MIGRTNFKRYAVVCENFTSKLLDKSLLLKQGGKKA